MCWYVCLSMSSCVCVCVCVFVHTSVCAHVCVRVSKENPCYLSWSVQFIGNPFFPPLHHPTQALIILLGPKHYLYRLAQIHLYVFCPIRPRPFNQITTDSEGP